MVCRATRYPHKVVSHKHLRAYAHLERIREHLLDRLVTLVTPGEVLHPSFAPLCYVPCLVVAIRSGARSMCADSAARNMAAWYSRASMRLREPQV